MIISCAKSNGGGGTGRADMVDGDERLAAAVRYFEQHTVADPDGEVGRKADGDQQGGRLPSSQVERGLIEAEGVILGALCRNRHVHRRRTVVLQRMRQRDGDAGRGGDAVCQRGEGGCFGGGAEGDGGARTLHVEASNAAGAACG